jgi:hypothetical protein
MGLGERERCCWRTGRRSRLGTVRGQQDVMHVHLTLAFDATSLAGRGRSVPASPGQSRPCVVCAPPGRPRRESAQRVPRKRATALTTPRPEFVRTTLATPPDPYARRRAWPRGHRLCGRLRAPCSLSARRRSASKLRAYDRGLTLSLYARETDRPDAEPGGTRPWTAVTGPRRGRERQSRGRPSADLVAKVEQDGRSSPDRRQITASGACSAADTALASGASRRAAVFPRNPSVSRDSTAQRS